MVSGSVIAAAIGVTGPTRSMRSPCVRAIGQSSTGCRRGDAVVLLDVPVSLGALHSFHPDHLRVGGDQLQTFDSGGPDAAVIELGSGSGVLSVQAGVQLQAAGDLRATTAANCQLRIGSSIQGAAILHKLGDGTLRLLGDNGQWTGAVRVDSGVVAIDHSRAVPG